ncbi:hypothetical protein, partial [Paenibacillus sp. FSL H8-0548]|uniref:hypothetical protein n=1 Tax=Paenibacillus sp. FSL H8-0548 TaxID=1920422 RepID=UPI001C4C7485
CPYSNVTSFDLLKDSQFFRGVQFISRHKKCSPYSKQALIISPVYRMGSISFLHRHFPLFILGCFHKQIMDK